MNSFYNAPQRTDLQIKGQWLMTVLKAHELLEGPINPETDAAGGLGPKTGSGDKEPMPSDVWGKIYGMRNGQLVLLYSLDDDGFKKMREQGKGNSVLSSDLDKKTHKYTTSHNGYSDKTYAVDSWGAFVEYAARIKLDLTGLALSPEQKKYRYEFELQNRQLSEGKLDFANLENMDLTGTDFTGAAMQQANLKNTSGKKPDFAKVNGYQADFSGSTYTEPDFSGMKAPRSVHFGSTYNLPVFGDTDWNSAHIVGSRFFLKHDNNRTYGDASVNVSSGLLAGCLFYGMDTDPLASPLHFSQAAFPGSCFYNINLTPGQDCKKADFSPLLLKDPRLTAPEQEFMRTFGQWLNSEKAMDGVKVSPEVNVPLDDSRIYSMFSEVRFDDQSYYAPLFFSKGQVLNRSSFHECEVADIAKILPKNMAERLGVVDAPVIQQVEPEQAAEPASAPVSDSNALPIPTIAFDKDEIALQVQALKTASIADTLSVGGKLQTALIDTTKLVSGWAMNHLGRQSLRDDVDKLAASIKAASMSELFTPPPAPAPAAEPPPPPQKKSSWRAFFSLSESEQTVMAASRPEAPPPPPDRFGVINEEMAAFPHSLGTSIDVNKEDVANAEKVKKFLQTMQDAFTAYIGELQAVAPELKDKNPDVLPYAEMRRKSLEESRNLVAKLNDSMGEFVRTTASDGAIYQWTQGVTIPSLTTEFTKAAVVYELAGALARDQDKALADRRLSGLYNALITGNTSKPAAERVQIVFNAIQENIVAQLQEIDKTLEKMQTQRGEILKTVLSPA